MIHSVLSLVILGSATTLAAQDWPQWRGPNREAKASDFNAPKEWPKELAKKWSVPVGQGDATPALVGDRIFVFARQEGRELIQCLDAATGKQIWSEGYDAQAATGPAGRHPGPRSSPAVADGKVITYGVRGTLSCWNAADGKTQWRHDAANSPVPRFFTASSPLVADGVCISQLGSEDKGGVTALNLANGDQKWNWEREGTAYSSPVLVTVGGAMQVVALTSKSLVGLDLKDGKLLWELPFAPQGRAYNAATPIVDGQTVIYTGAGRGTKAAKIEKQGDSWIAKELWSSSSNAVQYNSPALKNGLLFGIAQNGDFFCINAKDGSTAWTAPAPGGKSGFGSIVDAANALVALTPQSELIVFAASDKEFQKLASYKVAETETYAYPVLSKNRIYIKDRDSLTLFAVE